MTGTGKNASVNSYRTDIDGLRALAILSVLLYHSGVPLFSGGFTGVDIFFVISGYLIGGHIFSELGSGTFSFASFYQRRAKRILPAFYLVLAFTILAALLLLSPYEAAQFGRSAFWAALSASNILFWKTTGYFDLKSELNPLLMTWSLGVEEQFYAVIPLLLVLLTRVRRNLVLPVVLLSCVMSFLFAVREVGVHPTMVFYLLPARAWEMGIGVGLAIAERKGRIAWLSTLAQALGVAGLLLVLTPVFLLTVATPFPGVAALPSVLGTALLLATPSSWISKRLFSLPPLVFVGRISYSLYLWHWPLLALARVVCGGKLNPVVTVAMIAASFVAATLSYLFVEQPFRRSRRAPVPLLFRYAVVSAVVLAVCAILWLSNGISMRNPSLAKVEASGVSLVEDPCLAAYGSSKPNLSPGCNDPSTDKPKVALWGDSHSAAMAPGLRDAALAQGYAFEELSKASCPPLTGATRFVAEHPTLAADCLQFNKSALDLLKSDHNIRVVVLAAYWAAPFHQTPRDGWLTGDLAHQREVPTLEASNQLFEKGLTASIQSLLGAGKKVIVLDDVPRFEIDPLWRVRTNRIPLRRYLALHMGLQGHDDAGYDSPTDTKFVVQTSTLLQQAIANLNGATLVDLKPEFCNSSNQCLYRNQDSLLYVDPQHLSADGAKFALRGFHLPLRSSLDSQVGGKTASVATGSSPGALRM